MTEAEAEAGSRWARWQHWCADDEPTSERAIKRGLAWKGVAAGFDWWRMIHRPTAESPEGQR